jgi:acetyl esterase/lipase
MPFTIIPTVADIRWGRSMCQRMDQLKHPIRDAGGNPWIAHRHGGGGVVGSKEADWISTVGGGTFANFAQYLNTVKTAASDTHFDCIALGTRQAILSPPQFRGDQAFFPECVLDVKRAIMTIKTRAAEMGLDPNKGFLMGESHGGWLTLMTMCTAPLVGNGGSKTEQLRRYGAASFDSTVRGYISQSGMIDVRRTANVDQIHFTNLQAWFGTRADIANETGTAPNNTGVEWNAVTADLKAATSPLAYIENNDTRYFRPLYITGAIVGNHVHPYGDPNGSGSGDFGPSVHDSKQATDLYAAMQAKGLNATLNLFNRGDFDIFGSPTATALSLQLYTWLQGILAGSVLGT